MLSYRNIKIQKIFQTANSIVNVSDLMTKWFGKCLQITTIIYILLTFKSPPQRQNNGEEWKGLDYISSSALVWLWIHSTTNKKKHHPNKNEKPLIWLDIRLPTLLLKKYGNRFLSIANNGFDLDGLFAAFTPAAVAPAILNSYQAFLLLKIEGVSVGFLFIVN